MDKRWPDVALDALFAVIWFVSGYFGLSALGIPEWSLYAGLINVILGMWLIIIATRTEGQARRLYRGVRGKGAGGINIRSISELVTYLGRETRTAAPGRSPSSRR